MYSSIFACLFTVVLKLATFCQIGQETNSADFKSPNHQTFKSSNQGQIKSVEVIVCMKIIHFYKRFFGGRFGGFFLRYMREVNKVESTEIKCIVNLKPTNCHEPVLTFSIKAGIVRIPANTHLL